MVALRLRLLGGFAARESSGRAVIVPGRKNQALLAYIAMNAGRPLAREQLINLLWSDRGDSHARSSLRQALFALRRGLASIAPSPLAIGGEIIAADASAVSTDEEKSDAFPISAPMQALA